YDYLYLGIFLGRDMLTNTVCGDEYLFDFREAQIESVHGIIPTGTSVVSGTQVPHDEATLERYPNGLNRLGDSRIGEFLIPHSRREKEAAGMVLSDDLRKRVVEAVV